MRWSWFTSDHFFNKTRRERKEREERERAFYENGSKLLEKLIASCNAKPIPIRTFYPQQLLLATNNFSSEHLDWNGYKGSLEGRIVFIKPSYGWADLAINNLVISAKMSGHSNVLKPIGCCLHTPSPIFVFEFAANGVLADRIYVSLVTIRQHQPMVWKRRLKIARQISHAISYLHTAFPRPVIHMAINMRCILLDEHDVPKLSDFFFSVSIPEGETDVEVYYSFRNRRFAVPELKATGKVTEKTDVHSFGRFLLELLTGEDSYNITRLTIDEDSSLVAYIHNRAQGSCINEIVDPAILAEDGEGGATLEQQLQAFLDLALTCTGEDPQARPTMVDVTKQLRRIERARMKQTCEMETTCCPLCETEEETCLHLFKNCSVAKAAWFCSSWGFIESLNANNSFDLIKSIVCPPAHVLHEQITKEQFVLMAAKIMDHIWRLRNQVMFEDSKMNFKAIPFQNFAEI